MAQWQLRRFFRPLFWLGGLHAGIQAVGYFLSGGFALGGAALTLLLQTPLLFRAVLAIGAFLILFGLLNYAIGLIARNAEWGARESQAELANRLGTTIINYGQIQMGSVAGAEQGIERASESEEPSERGDEQQIPDASELPPPEDLPPELLFAPHLEWESFYITQMLPGSGGLRRRVFENCRIHGPAILAPMNTGHVGGYSFVGCAWAENEDAFWQIPPSSGEIVGVVALEDCIFRGCYFVKVGLMVTPGDYDRVIEGHRRQRAELEGEPSASDEKEPTNS
jgi:hypothetical protein